MRQNLTYDLPTRFFHWMFVALFLTAFIIGKTAEDDSAVFSYHMLMGLMIGFLVILRLVWGFVGTKHARFSGFSLKPIHLINYFQGLMTGDKKRWAGHNPASSWVALIMMALALCLGVTGYLMASGVKEEVLEDAHEIFGNALIIVAIIHVVGIVIHTLRHKEMIGLSMFDGKKENINAQDIIPSAKSAIGVLLLALMVAFAILIKNNYNAETKKLQFFGNTLQLEKNEDHSHH